MESIAEAAASNISESLSATYTLQYRTALFQTRQLSKYFVDTPLNLRRDRKGLSAADTDVLLGAVLPMAVLPDTVPAAMRIHPAFGKTPFRKAFLEACLALVVRIQDVLQTRTLLNRHLAYLAYDFFRCNVVAHFLRFSVFNGQFSLLLYLSHVFFQFFNFLPIILNVENQAVND